MNRLERWLWLTGLLCVSLISLYAQEDGSMDSSATLSGLDKHSFSIFAGGVLPLGDLSDPNIGAAKTGFSLGAQVVFRNRFLLRASYTSNPSSIASGVRMGSSSNWKSGVFVTGLRIGRMGKQNPAFFVAPIIGVALISSPTVEYSITETFPGLVTTRKYSTASVSTSALAYGVVVGLDARRLTFALGYVSSNPTFDLTTHYSTDSGFQSTTESSVQWHMSLLQFSMGILF
jgi:hypothetical protein